MSDPADDDADEPTQLPPSQGAGTTSTTTRALSWGARVAWVLVAVLGGTALESATDGRTPAVGWVAAIGGWVGFAIVALALAIPSVVSLTVARVASPLAIVAGVVSALAGAPALEIALLCVPAFVAVATIYTAELGRWMVQASAYGDEHRLPLRAPVAAGTAAVVTWFAWAACVVAAPLALASSRWAVGIPLGLVAAAATILLGPRWHRLSRRWLVLVPAGLVVHDPVVLADTLMVRAEKIAGIGLARTGTEAADLTGPASGFAIEVSTSEQVSTVFAFTPRDPDGVAIHMVGFLVAPSRPGAALRLAAERRLPIR
ncbi:hypothetical protein [Ilumatobacter sp.]|uniref:hypothetical protein n=1 Tax=Ilumatobacter sp. TaxID=1967498 RepID=UPI003B526D1F